MSFATRKPSVRGFTLIDVLGALVLVSVGIAAVMQFIASSTTANSASGHQAVASILAANVHEYALSLDPGLPPETTSPITHALQLNGQVFSPPRDGQGEPISGMTGWSQSISVVSVNRWDMLGSPVAATATNLRRLRVTVNYGGKTVYASSWILAPSVPQS